MYEAYYNPYIMRFGSDFKEGGHRFVMQALEFSNYLPTDVYGGDPYSIKAEGEILEKCQCPDGEVKFFASATAANACAIDALLGMEPAGSGPAGQPDEGQSGPDGQPDEGQSDPARQPDVDSCLKTDGSILLCADTAWPAGPGADFIRLGGINCITVPGDSGKISPDQIEQIFAIRKPKIGKAHVVYISQPTELGTIYSLEELGKLSKVCHENGAALYLDGARLAYALASEENDASLSDLARLCHAFLIGGSRCGALFGEALVITEKGRFQNFEAVCRRRGALFGKTRPVGAQFDALFQDYLYGRIGSNALANAGRFEEAVSQMGYKLYAKRQANMIFFIMPDEDIVKLAQKVDFRIISRYDENHSVVRIAISWFTPDGEVDSLIDLCQYPDGHPQEEQ